MDDASLIKRLEKDLTRIVAFEVAGEMVIDGDQTLFLMKINAPPYICIVSNFDYGIIREAANDNAKWAELLTTLHSIILNRTFQLIVVDLEKIHGTLTFYATNCFKHFRTPASYKKSHVDMDILDQLGVQTFVYRIGGQCQTVKVLSDMGLDHFINMELSIGILLRSCILDCLYIMAWCNDDKLISAIAAESFLRKQGRNVADQVRNHYRDIAAFFNIDNLNAINATRLDNILNTLDGKPNIQWYENLYMYYSKYDHFSLIPHIAYKSPAEKLEMVLLGTHMIKHSLCALLTMKNKEHSDKFQEILDIKNVSEDGLNYSFVFKD
jgi:hypothetical protein